MNRTIHALLISAPLLLSSAAEVDINATPGPGLQFKVPPWFEQER